MLFLVTAYPRDPGDVITPWLVELIHRLRERDIRVEVLAPAYRGSPSQDLAGVRVHRFRYAPAPWERLSHEQTVPDRLRERPIFWGLIPPYMIRGSLAATRLVRKGSFNLLHAYWPLPHALFGIAGKRSGGVPLVATFFGVELTWIDSRLPFLRPVLRRMLRECDAVTAISSYTAGMLRALDPAIRPRIIPFGAAVEKTWSSKSVQRAHGGPFRLLFVGRLVERKGVKYLLEAVLQVRHSYPVELRIVGDGPLREPLQRYAAELGLQDHARFEGLLAASDLERLFRTSDVCVLPAVFDAKGDTEGLGVVLVESLSFGTPVIASAVGGIPDIVRHEQTGLLVPPGDPSALAEAIRLYIERPELASALAREGQRYVQEAFSWEAITGQLASLYQGVLAAKGAGS